jgi:hypothetical protein
MKAVIFQPARGVMQSGRGKTGRWRVEFEPEAGRAVEPLMGWTSATDMNQEVDLLFDDREAAVAYCQRNGIEFRVREPKQRRVRIRAYADNFSSASVRGPGTAPIERP